MYTKINKTKARELHAEGKSVYVLPSKANPNCIWWNPLPKIPQERDFDKFCNEYRFYNCNLYSVGKTIAFYIKEN